MARGDLKSVALGVGLLTVVGIGYAVGRSLGVIACSRVTALTSLSGMGLGLAGVIRRPRSDDRQAVERIAGIGLLGYVVVATVTEPFAWVYTSREVVVAVGWLAPLAAGGVLLPRRGCWLAGLGCWAVLFAGTAAVSYTTCRATSGVGLFSAWIE